MKVTIERLVLLGVVVAACGETSGTPSVSSKSSWVRCSDDAKCEAYAGVCGASGYCETVDGERIERDSASLETDDADAEDDEAEDTVTNDSEAETVDSGAAEASSDELRPISPETTPELFEGETSILGDWVKVTDAPYSMYLRIDGAEGFACYNDGKSASSVVEFVNGADGTFMRGIAGHGELTTLGRIQLDAESGELTLLGSEKGFTYVETFNRGERPDVCQRVEDGEEVTFEEFEASWN